MIQFTAHFDGKHLLPDEPVDLPAGKPLRVTVEEVPAPADLPPLNLEEFFGKIIGECGLVEGPEDWSVEHDHYIYGTPKQHGPDGK